MQCVLGPRDTEAETEEGKRARGDDAQPRCYFHNSILRFASLASQRRCSCGQHLPFQLSDFQNQGVMNNHRASCTGEGRRTGPTLRQGLLHLTCPPITPRDADSMLKFRVWWVHNFTVFQGSTQWCPKPGPFPLQSPSLSSCADYIHSYGFSSVTHTVFFSPWITAMFPGRLNSARLTFL